MMQTILTVVFYIWLFLTLLLLWGMWTGSIKIMRGLQSTLINAALTSAEAAQKAADAAQKIAKHLESSDHEPH